MFYSSATTRPNKFLLNEPADEYYVRTTSIEINNITSKQPSSQFVGARVLIPARGSKFVKTIFHGERVLGKISRDTYIFEMRPRSRFCPH